MFRATNIVFPYLEIFLKNTPVVALWEGGDSFFQVAIPPFYSALIFYTIPPYKRAFGTRNDGKKGVSFISVA